LSLSVVLFFSLSPSPSPLVLVPCSDAFDNDDDDDDDDDDFFADVFFFFFLFPLSAGLEDSRDILEDAFSVVFFFFFGLASAGARVGLVSLLLWFSVALFFTLWGFLLFFSASGLGDVSSVSARDDDGNGSVDLDLSGGGEGLGLGLGRFFFIFSVVFFAAGGSLGFGVFESGPVWSSRGTPSSSSSSPGNEGLAAFPLFSRFLRAALCSSSNDWWMRERGPGMFSISISAVFPPRSMCMLVLAFVTLIQAAMPGRARFHGAVDCFFLSIALIAYVYVCGFV